MKPLIFISEIPKGMLYGHRGTFTPGILGSFSVNLHGPSDELIYGILMGEKTFKEKETLPFRPIGFVKVNDHGSVEYYLLGVRGFYSPNRETCRNYLNRVLEFARKNAVVMTYGDAEAALKITEELLG